MNSPASLGEALTLRDDDHVFLAGQMTGVEGYTESLGTGLLAGINLARRLSGRPPRCRRPPPCSAGLYRYLRDADPRHFQPMNANFGLLEPLARGQMGRWADGQRRMPKEQSKELLVARAQRTSTGGLADL